VRVDRKTKVFARYLLLCMSLICKKEQVEIKPEMLELYQPSGAMKRSKSHHQLTFAYKSPSWEPGGISQCSKMALRTP